MEERGAARLHPDAFVRDPDRDLDHHRLHEGSGFVPALRSKVVVAAAAAVVASEAGVEAPMEGVSLPVAFKVHLSLPVAFKVQRRAVGVKMTVAMDGVAGAVVALLLIVELAVVMRRPIRAQVRSKNEREDVAEEEDAGVKIGAPKKRAETVARSRCRLESAWAQESEKQAPNSTLRREQAHKIETCASDAAKVVYITQTKHVL